MLQVAGIPQVTKPPLDQERSGTTDTPNPALGVERGQSAGKYPPQPVRAEPVFIPIDSATRAVRLDSLFGADCWTVNGVEEAGGDKKG